MQQVVAVLDIDCFENQVWHKYYNNGNAIKNLKKQRPTVVADSTGRILSANPQAKRDYDISREIRLPEAVSICPNLNVLDKPNKFEKPDNKPVRNAQREILTCIRMYLTNWSSRNGRCNVTLEYNAGDEIFFDLTEYVNKSPKNFPDDKVFSFMFGQNNSFYESHDVNEFMDCPEATNFSKKNGGHSFQYKLWLGGYFMNQMIEHLAFKTGYKASGGVGSTKLLAKVGCNYNKPQAITMLTMNGYQRLISDMTVNKIPGIGEGTEESIRDTLGDQFLWANKLSKVRRDTLQRKLGDIEGAKVFDILRGTYNDPVVFKLFSNAVNCSKINLRLSGFNQVTNTLCNLLREMLERIMEEKEWNGRFPAQLPVTITFRNESIIVFEINYVEWDTFQTLKEKCFEQLSQYVINNPPNVFKINIKAADFRISCENEQSIYN